MTTLASYLKCAAAAAVLLAGPGAFAKDGTHGDGVRSAQSLPPVGSPVYQPQRGDDKVIADLAATPPYCSGNKYGIYNGKGEKNGNGKALTCAKSPG